MSYNTLSFIQSFIIFVLVFIILHQKFKIEDLTDAYNKCAEYREGLNTVRGIE